jgi:hypothetical protein
MKRPSIPGQAVVESWLPAVERAMAVPSLQLVEIQAFRISFASRNRKTLSHELPHPTLRRLHFSPYRNLEAVRQASDDRCGNPVAEGGCGAMSSLGQPEPVDPAQQALA